MENYTHDIPTKVYFGKGSISHLDESLAPFGKNVLLAYGGGSIKKTGLYDEVMKILNEGGFTVTELSGIEPNPRIESVERGVQLCKENNIDVVLAVGGGSVIDCAKAVCSGFYYEGDDLWYMVKYVKGRKRSLPLVDILTLSATGSDFDNGGVISNLKTNEKLGCGFTFPSVSILDPTYTYTVSKYQTAAGSADIMSHIMEGYFSKTEDSDLADGIAETILKSVIKNLPVALKEPDNYSARANLMHAESVACSGIPEYGKLSTGWPCHGMEHELSAFYDITHGAGLGILTPRWMRFILKKDPSCQWRFVRFAKNVWGLEGEDEHELAVKGIDALEQFFRDCELPMTLSEFNIGPEHFEEMAEHTLSVRRYDLGLVPLEKEDIVNILNACL
ncbi:MAG: iron-containing alcohol dehydrogenase [Erysipelotrichaceae bacterium]|nr:iron-containing alcohol dehydrogenase [Erysipelotrichaceae bacterium]